MLIKILIIGLAAYILYRLFKNDFLHKKQSDDLEDKKDREAKIATGEMVKDPECGTYVTKDSGITVRDGQTVHHFCSYECREKFLNRLREGGRQIPPLE